MKIKLREPYWGAWKKFNWEKGTPAYSVKKSLISDAIKAEEDIIVEYKGTSYKLKMEEFRKWYSECEMKPLFQARGTTLVCIPKFMYEEL